MAKKNKFIAGIATVVARAVGYRLQPMEIPNKCVLIGAPHTSNWDGVLMVMLGWKGGFKMRFFCKNSLFKFPLGPIIRFFGGIPVDRSHPNGLVGQMVEEFSKADVLRLAITPEGTRSWRPYWKSGFYNIALGANVPIVLGYLDRNEKVVAVTEIITLTGDPKTDMDKIREFYRGKEGVRPDLSGPIKLRIEDEES